MTYRKRTITPLIAVFLLHLFAACGNQAKTPAVNSQGSGSSTVPDGVDSWDSDLTGGGLGSLGGAASLSDLNSSSVQSGLDDLIGSSSTDDLMGGLQDLNNATTNQGVTNALNSILPILQQVAKGANAQSLQQFGALLQQLSKDIESQKKNPQSMKSFIGKLISKIKAFIKSVLASLTGGSGSTSTTGSTSTGSTSGT